MRSIITKSYAKINISLVVEGKREDGYHLLDGVMVPIELHDSIVITELFNGKDNMISVDDFSEASIEYNVASVAINKLSEKYGFKNKFRILIHKVIPIKAGLGGGSSNAAFTMKAVCGLLKLPYERDVLIDIASTLGADVPFFIDCKPVRARGIGEKLEPITIKNNYYCLIVKPNKGLSTKDVFAQADCLELKTGNIDDVVKALETGDDILLKNSIVNALEEPAIQLLPEIKQIKQKMYDLGLDIVQMSGSGSTVFALDVNKAKLKKVLKYFEDLDYVCELTKIIK